MDEYPNTDDPSKDSTQQPLPPPPVKSAIEPAEVSQQSQKITAHQEEPTMDLGKSGFRIFEIASLGVQVILALIGIGALCVYGRQLAVMRGTLKEMKRSGEQSTEQVWRAIDNLNWMARSMDESQRGIQAAIEHSDRLAKRALDASITQSNLDRRSWVGLQLLQCLQCKTDPDGSLIVGNLSSVLVNTGKTPAVDMVVDVFAYTAKAGDPPSTYDAIRDDMERRFAVGLSLPKNMPPDIAASIAKSLEVTKRQTTRPKEVLAPNASRPMSIIVGLRQERNMRMRTEDKPVLYGLGKIIYYDTSRSVKHTTTFCVVNYFGTEFTYCPSGNDMN